MDKFTEAPNNPFDAPIPGQGLTDKPGNYPWEHPPQYTDTMEASEFIWDKLTEPLFAQQIIGMLDAGVSVEAIARTVVFAGFTEGKFTPDVGFMLAETVMKMIATIGFTGDVKKFRISMQDLTNNKQMKEILNLKSKNEELKKASKSLAKDIKAIPEQKGLMAAPQPKEEEVA
tara:strand:+ start:491 stop:1009 length:519 start_codon:yes stop_codon:yes gene_type:complete